MNKDFLTLFGQGFYGRYAYTHDPQIIQRNYCAPSVDAERGADPRCNVFGEMTFLGPVSSARHGTGRTLLAIHAQEGHPNDPRRAFFESGRPVNPRNIECRTKQPRKPLSRESWSPRALSRVPRHILDGAPASIL